MVVVGLLATSCLSFLCGFFVCVAVSKCSEKYCLLALVCVPFVAYIGVQVIIATNEDVNGLYPLRVKCTQTGLARTAPVATGERFEFVEAQASDVEPVLAEENEHNKQEGLSE